jgi:AraC-like DNA-binding protein
MSYSEAPPPPHLAPYIEAFWTSTSNQPIDNFPIHPDGCMDILLDQSGRTRLIGVMPTTQIFSSPAGFHIEGIRFHPGILPSILPIDALEIAGHSLTVKSFSIRQIPSTPLTPIQRALAHLRHQHGNTSLDWLASQTNLSVRHFRRLTLNLTGLSPKHLARILRFRHARNLKATHPSSTWTTVALNAGYFDQAHFIRDHRALTGHSPTFMSETYNSKRSDHS